MDKPRARLVILSLAATGVVLGLRAVARNKARYEFHGRSVVITGGSRGLGLELARILGEEGARLALLARDEAIGDQNELRGQAPIT